MKYDAIVISPSDNVATSLGDIEAQSTAQTVLGEELLVFTVNEPIPFGHKFAIKEINAGESIIKYGEIIGKATVNILRGEHAHVHNIESLRGRGDL